MSVVMTEAAQDISLLAQTLTGDESAFTALYRRRQSAIYRFALQMSGSVVVAEEVTQDTFMTLIHDGHRFDASRGTLLSFLFGIARNLVLRTLERDRSNRYVALDDSPAEHAETSAIGPLDDLTRRESVAAVRRAVLSLPETYREVVVLCDLEEVSYADAAEVLGCAIGTVRSRLHRGRAMLLEKLRIWRAPVAATQAEFGRTEACLL
ncbi:MAG: RNA polymerase sigma factor [Bryobacteraceae bacterium]